MISHRPEKGEVISVGPNDTLLTAFKRMRSADVSQLPVLNGDGRAVGIIDESDLLVKVHRDPAKFNDLVKSAMTDRLETLVARGEYLRLVRRLRSRPGRDRDGRRQVPRPDHADRSALLSPAAHAEVS